MCIRDRSCIGVYTCGNVCMYIFVTLWIYEYNNSLHGVIWCLIGPPNIWDIRYSIFSLEYLSLGTLIVSHFKKICHLRWSYMALTLRHKIHESLLIFVNHSWRLWRIRLKLWLYLEKMFYYRVWWFHEYHYKWILASNANEWWSLPETWRGSNYKIFNIL